MKKIICFILCVWNLSIFAQDENSIKVDLEEEVIEEVVEPPKEKTWRKIEQTIPYILSYPYPKNGYENLTQKLQKTLKLNPQLELPNQMYVGFKVQDDGSCKDYQVFYDNSQKNSNKTLIINILKEIIETEKWFPMISTRSKVQTHIPHHFEIKFDTKTQRFKINPHKYASHFVPKNGFQKLLNDIQSELKYPQKLLEKRWQGIAYFHCKITEAGKIQDSKLIPCHKENGNLHVAEENLLSVYVLCFQ